MNKEDWKKVTQVRLEVCEQDEEEYFTWSFPIRCPRWLFNLLSKLEKNELNYKSYCNVMLKIKF